jgi:hypothetical protein
MSRSAWDRKLGRYHPNAGDGESPHHGRGDAMKTPDQVSRACVSFWCDGDKLGSKFVGNGFIVADEWVMTAMHVVSASTCMRINGDPKIHVLKCEDRQPLGNDLALVKLTNRPISATRLRVSAPETVDVGTKLIYSGFTLDVPADGEADRADPPAVEFEIQATSKTEPQTETCFVQGNFPRGHSGCAVRMGDTVVAVVIADAPGYPYGLIYPLSRVASLLQAWVPKAFLPLETTLRKQFEACFEDRIFVEIGARKPDCFLPDELDEALPIASTMIGGVGELGEKCMDAILKIASKIEPKVKTMKKKENSDFKSDLEILRKKMCNAMEIAIRIVVDPTWRYQSEASSVGVIELNAQFLLTGVLAMMENKAAENWPEVANLGREQIPPKNVLKAPRRESGSGAFQLVDIREMIRNTLPDDISSQSDLLTDEEADELLANLLSRNMLMYGQRFFLVESTQLNTLNEEAKKWLNETIGFLVISISMNKKKSLPYLEISESRVWANIAFLLHSLHVSTRTQP